MVEVYSERVERGDKDVDPEVELCVVNKVGTTDVALHHQGRGGVKLAPLVHHLQRKEHARSDLDDLDSKKTGRVDLAGQSVYLKQLNNTYAAICTLNNCPHIGHV